MNFFMVEFFGPTLTPKQSRMFLLAQLFKPYQSHAQSTRLRIHGLSFKEAGKRIANAKPSSKKASKNSRQKRHHNGSPVTK